MTGSAPQYQHNGRGPRSSINHVTVHDGFTLNDLVSYQDKHNEANGEDNRDGSDDNISVNFGVEGPTDDEGINAIRRQLRRNQIACLMLAQGVPLILAGDEAANTQNGNNNTYCQDNDIGWVDWSKLGTEDDLTDLIGTLKRMRDTYPQLQPRQWLVGERADGTYDVKWLTPSASEMAEADWNFPAGRFLAYVLAAPDETGTPLFMVLNAAEEEIEFTFPEWPNVQSWTLVFETTGQLSEKGGGPASKAIAPGLSVTVYEGRA
jgi:glycogen operon protein